MANCPTGVQCISPLSPIKNGVISIVILLTTLAKSNRPRHSLLSCCHFRLMALEPFPSYLNSFLYREGAQFGRDASTTP